MRIWGRLQPTRLRKVGWGAWLLALLGACTFAPRTEGPPVPGPGVPASAPTPDAPASAASAVEPVALRQVRLGLALGGGAARGFAHIGVIQALEAAGISPDVVVGTSAGSLVAALYASGKSGQELSRMAADMDETAITDWTFPGRGLLRGQALAQYVRQATGGLRIEQMKRTLGIVATELATGRPIVFRQGDPGVAVRASSAVPAVFQPVRIGAVDYVDGGLVAPVPVRFTREAGAELVIAVDISAAPEAGGIGNPFSVLLQTFSIMGRSINQFELQTADVVMRPALDGVASSDFASRQRSIQAGREVAQAMLPRIRERIALAQRSPAPGRRTP